MPTMAKQPVGGFAELLQRLRVRAGLTQDELAEAAGVSPRTVSDLERGINRTARKDTAGLLADAMGLTGREREQFLAAARGKPTAAELAASSAMESQKAVEQLAGMSAQLNSLVAQFKTGDHADEPAQASENYRSFAATGSR